MNTPTTDYTLEKLVRGVCKQIEAFTVSRPSSVSNPHHDLSQNEAQVNGNPYPGFTFGQQGLIDSSHLVLISIKRISQGAWVPVVRLVNSK
jgi:hypothetical protein